MKRSGFKKPSLEKLKALQDAKRKRFKQKLPNIKKTRKTTTAAKNRRKKGIWATTTADNYFSKWIRNRDEKCLRCHTTEGLTCSHYHKRAISITRFDPENCIALCGACHADWEGPKEGYTDFMIEWLGLEKFVELQRRAGRFMKREEAVAICKAFLKAL